MSVIEFERFKTAKIMQFRENFRAQRRPHELLEAETELFERRLEAVRRIVQQPELRTDDLA